jgi:hypothetical protein
MWDALTRKHWYILNLGTRHLPELGRLPDSEWRQTGWSVTKGFSVDPKSRYRPVENAPTQLIVRQSRISSNDCRDYKLCGSSSPTSTGCCSSKKADQCNLPINGGVLSKRNEIKVVRVRQDSLLYYSALWP